MSKRVQAEAQAKVTSAQVKDALALRFSLPEWWLETEVTLRQRRLDVVAVQLWGGRRLVGVEVKVSRGDWLAEVKQWHKHEEWAAVVDHFYIAAPKGVVQPEELPKGWGLLELLEGGGLRVKVQPVGTPGDGVLPRELVARFLMRAADQLKAMEHRLVSERSRARIELINEVTAQQEAQWQERQARLGGKDTRDADQWRRLMQAVGEEDWYAAERVRDAVAVLKAHKGLPEVQRAQRDLTHAGETLQKLRGQLDGVAAVMSAVTQVAQALEPEGRR